MEISRLRFAGSNAFANRVSSPPPAPVAAIPAPRIRGNAPPRVLGIFDPSLTCRVRALQESQELREALFLIRPDKLHADIKYLSSDTLKGRDTPSAGLQQAGDYVVERLQAHGWQPGGPHASYEYLYELWGVSVDNAKTVARMKFGDKTEIWRYGEDFFYGALGPKKGRGTEPVILKGEVVLVGEGLAKGIPGISLQGKWLLYYDDVPPEVRRKEAMKVGANGVLVAPNPKTIPDPRQIQHLVDHFEEARATGRVYYAPGEEIDEIILGVAAAEKLFISMMGKGGSTGPFGNPAWKSIVLTSHRVEKTKAAKVGASNYVGFLPGTDPVLSNEVILVTAHLDHLGERWGRIYNGADDNASGSAALLALLESVRALKLPRSVMMMWVTGEEKGLLGSDAWARNPFVPNGAKVIANINMDMVGRNASDRLSLTPTQARGRDYNNLAKTFETHAAAEGITQLESGDRYWSRSDHYSFSRHLGIPVVFLSSDLHPDYHKPTDTEEKINKDGMARRTRLVVRVLDALRTGDVKYPHL